MHDGPVAGHVALQGGEDVVFVENATAGSGLTPAMFRKLMHYGIDVCTMGDHIYRRREIVSALESSELERLIAESVKMGDASTTLKGKNEKQPESITFMPKEPGEYLLILRADPRPDENTPNATVSYYAKGALVALCLDLTLRAEGRGSLDDVMRRLWKTSRGGPIAEADLTAKGVYTVFMLGSAGAPYGMLRKDR